MRRPLRTKVFFAFFLVFSALTLFTLIFTNQRPIFGQTDGVLPWVVSTTPARGEELGVDQPITFTFNTAMNRESVESAFRMTPSVAGSFRWQSDTLFTFVPAYRLVRETAYIFEIDSRARSQEGVPLRDTFSLKLYTSAYLKVTQFLPEDQGVQISLEPTITIVFNRPVVPLGTAQQMKQFPAPFKSNHPITGKGEWLTTSIYSIKTDPLKEGTLYKFTIPQGFVDISGSTVKSDITFSFSTLTKTPKTVEPRIFALRYVFPEEGRAGLFRNVRITMGFEHPADTASVEAAFALTAPDGHKIPGKFEWKEENYEVRFKPGELLDYSTRYTITLDRTKARGKNGIPLYKGWSSWFTVMDKPEIVSTSPNDGTLVGPSGRITISFNAPMKLDDLASHLEVRPKTPVVVLDSDIGPDSASASLQFSTLPSTIYTVTIDPGRLVDIWGTPLQVPIRDHVYRIVDGKIQFRFVTSALGPAMSLETNGQALGMYNAYHQTRVFVTHRNIGTVGLTLNRIPLAGFLNQDIPHNDRDGEAISLVRRWVVPVYNPPNIMRYDLLALTTDGASIGQQGNVVCVEAAPSQLKIGQKIRVVRRAVPQDDNQTPTAPAPINVRNQPGTQDTAIIGQAEYGSEFLVLDGPVCADRYVWWQVQNESGAVTGWIAEGDAKQAYVVPLDDTGEATAIPGVAATTTPLGSTPAALPLTPGGLPPGIYRLELIAPDIATNGYPLAHTMLIATDNITLKISTREVVAWVTDLKSGKPTVGVPVIFYRLMQRPRTNEQKFLPYGSPVITDQHGLARLVSDDTFNPAGETIFAYVGGRRFGLASSMWVQGIDAGDFQQPTMFVSQDTALYVYSDRRLYKPGEKVYFKGTLRLRDDAVYSLSPVRFVPVEVVDPFQKIVYSRLLPVNQFGSFSDNFTLDKAAALGEYRVIARPNKPRDSTVGVADILRPTAAPASTVGPIPFDVTQRSANDPTFVTQITVGDYTPPEFRVNIKPESLHVAPGDTIRAVVDSSYYFGGPVSNAVVQWELRTDPYYFFYTGSGAYSFEDYNQDFIAQDYADDRPQVVSNGQGRTNDEGRFTIEIPATLGKSRRSLIYTIEALVWDQSNQVVAERAQIVVHQGQFHVGVGVDNYVGTVSETQNVRLIAVNHTSQPLASVPLNVSVVRRVWASVQTIEPGTGRTVWENQLVEKEIASGLIHTDANGKGNFSFMPRVGGAYKIYASARDRNDNLVKGSTFLWIAGPDYVAWRQHNSNRIDLQADRTSYKVGDTASILIPTPFQGQATALITIERGSILRSEVVTFTSNSTIYKLPITPDMAPNAFVSVTVIKGEDANNFTAAFRSGLLQLQVDSEQLQLNVFVDSDRKKAGPREEVTYKVRVTDYKNDPVQAEVGLALVDEAIIALMPDNLPSLMRYFYSNQGLGVRTATALIFSIDQQTQEIINVQKGGGKGGDDYFGVFTIRKNFITTPLWSPFVITDANGEASVTVTLPDQLTTWVLDARVYTRPTGPTKTTLVGQTTHSLVSTRPLLIRPEVPPFFVVGDRSMLSAIVNNNTDEAQEVAVTLEIAGATVETALTQYATVSANNRLRFDWPMTVQDTDALDVTFKVVSKDGRYTDAAKPVTGEGDERLIRVLRYETPDTVATGGVIGNAGGKRVEGLLLPAVTAAPGSAKDSLEIRVDRSLASGMTAALKALEIFPYYCIEQTVSRFLPDAVTFQAQRKLGIQNAELQEQLFRNLETALQRLYSDQQADGGWGWFIGDRSDQLISAYTMLGLTEAKAAGWQIDKAVYEKAYDGLVRSLRRVSEKTDPWDLNRQAFILYVIARTDQVNNNRAVFEKNYPVSRYVSLFNQRDRMNLDAQAFLAMSFAIVEPSSGYHTKPLLDNIKRAAQYTLTGRFWRESFTDMWNWTTDTRTTAIVLKALVEIEPDSDLIPDTVRWLMTARKLDRWETTQETAWSVMALTAWMVSTGDLRPTYDFGIAINDKTMAEGEQANADTVSDSYTLRVAVNQLLRDQLNRIAFQRTPGDGSMYYNVQLNTYLPVEQVKAISRGITITRTYSMATDKQRRPIALAHVGDRIRVTLTIVVPEALNYAVIEDPIPAGTQAINTSLQTSQKFSADRPLEYGWWYWVFTHTELRSDRTVLYAPWLPAGTYQYIYELRAGAEGQYHVLPANGHAFYLPEVFGRTYGRHFIIYPRREEPPDELPLP